MKTKKSIVAGLLLSGVLLLASCGPVVVSSRIGHPPPPPWFYPNRLEIVRYVYFPEYRMYFDLSARTYIYWDSGSWVRRNRLPPRYRNVNLNRSRYVRIRDYHDDDIKRYDDQKYANRGRSNRTTPRKRN